MKKSNTLFTLAFFAILAFSSCEREQWGNAQKGPDDIDNRAEGQIYPSDYRWTYNCRYQ